MTLRSRHTDRPLTELDRYLHEEVALPKPGRRGAQTDTASLALPRPNDFRRAPAPHRPPSVAARRICYDRDHGVCVLCAFDAVAAYQEWKDAEQLDRHLRECNNCGEVSAAGTPCLNCGSNSRRRAFTNQNQFRLALMTTNGFSKKFASAYNGSQALWIADHIVPIVEGGAELDPQNLRTLCVPCNDRVTAELRARLATKHGHRRAERIAR